MLAYLTISLRWSRVYLADQDTNQAGYVASKTNFNISLLLSLLACVSTNKNKSERIEELRAARTFVTVVFAKKKKKAMMS